MYRLHSFCQSGNCHKVALTLQLLRQPWEPVFVDFMNGATRSSAWRDEFNEMGEAPVLEFIELGEETRLTQSGLIMTVLAERHADFMPALAGRNTRERREVLRWLLFDNHKFTSYLATYRFMKSFGASAPDPAVLAFLKTRMDAAFAIVESHLRTRPFLVGDHLSLADLSLSAYLFYPDEEFGGDVLAGYPYLRAWVIRLMAIPGLKGPYELLPGERIAPRW
jgi:glutathione S-transferase